jgi:2-keto-4-pentenoate hydratase/2-oxohepta-3-ene-1,7-dioic acid hydratase in catechol pathway
MKLVTFADPKTPHESRLGIIRGETVFDLDSIRVWAQNERKLTSKSLPRSMMELLNAGYSKWNHLHEMIGLLNEESSSDQEETGWLPAGKHLNAVLLLPPLPRPVSIRDFYAFEDHVAAARASRGEKVPEEWYQIPVFYFSNANAITGPGEIIPIPPATQKLDFELEVACIIKKPGTNIPPDQAEEYIFGFTILNDWSARDIQRQETRVGLGPAKGKDFATSIGPCIVTPDELEDRSTGRPGVYDLQMRAYINGELRSQGNWKDIHYSFGELIARASQGAWLIPGEVIGSGTVGSGCLLELTQGKGPWLQPGDVLELEIERLGVLANTVGDRFQQPLSPYRFGEFPHDSST